MLILKNHSVQESTWRHLNQSWGVPPAFEPVGRASDPSPRRHRGRADPCSGAHGRVAAEIATEISAAYRELSKRVGKPLADVAARSSVAAAESSTQAASAGGGLHERPRSSRAGTDRSQIHRGRDRFATDETPRGLAKAVVADVLGLRTDLDPGQRDMITAGIIEPLVRDGRILWNGSDGVYIDNPKRG